MPSRNRVVSGLLVGALAVAGGCSDVPPTEPLALDAGGVSLFRGAPQDPASFSGGLDATFSRMAREIPGFGGLYYDEAGNLNVRVAAGAMAASEVHDALRGWLSTLGVDAAAARRAVVREAEYDFLELLAMRSRADAVFGLRGVVFTDADEAANRVHIGVENEAVAANVEHALAMLDIPREAVIISITEPEVPMSNHTLRDMVRPVAGGLQINFTRGDPPAGFICTLSFNVRSPVAPNVQGFVTNSHCSDTRGVVVPTPYWQHSRFVEGTFIGWEAHDIPFFTTPPCPMGTLCRWSDALGARYEPGIDNAFGRIYRPTEIGSLEIDPTTPMFNIVAERPRTLVGDDVNKVGRTTGWSSGTSIASCVNVGVAGTDPLQVMLCQDRFSMTPGTMGGDSGSPMFQVVGPNEVRVVGILWGTTTFSPMENIRFENQGPAPWIIFPGQTPPPPPSGPPGAP